MIAVYVFRHCSGYYYIGSTSDFNKRRIEHLVSFRNRKHHISEIQNIFKDDSEITWETIQCASREEAYTLERNMIGLHSGNPFLVNRQLNGWKPTNQALGRERSAQLRTGVPLPESQRNKISNSLSGHKRTPDEIEKSAAKRRIPLMIDGVRHISCAAAAVALGVCENTVMNRVRSNSPQFASWLFAEKGDNHAP